MSTINISDLVTPISVGLDWYLLPGTTSERKEIAELAKKHSANFGVVVTNDKTGFTVLGLSSEKKAGAPSGAAWLAKASAGESMVLIEPIQNGKIWLCAVRAGLPVQGLDIVIDESQLHEKLPEFLETSQDSRIYSTYDNISDLGYGNISSQSFAELVSNTKQERIARIAGIPTSLMVVAVAGIIVSAIWYGTDIYFTQIEYARNLVLNENKNQKQIAGSIEAARKTAAKRLEDAQSLIKNAVLKQPSVGNIIDALFTSVERMPTSTAGWNLVGLDCTTKNCTFSWLRTRVGTVLGFIESAESKGWTITHAEGDTATTESSIDAEPRVATIDDLSIDSVFRVAFETKLQKLKLIGIDYQLKKSESIEKSLPQSLASSNKSAPASPALVSAPLPWKVGDVTIRGKNLFALRAMPDYLEHPGVAVKHVSANLSQNEWNLEVNYATR